MDHNEKHREEYAAFAAQLEQAGKQASAVHVREMADLAGKSNACLSKALKALESMRVPKTPIPDARPSGGDCDV